MLIWQAVSLFSPPNRKKHVSLQGEINGQTPASRNKNIKKQNTTTRNRKE